jgi:two-component system, cell cycle response regulator DivK
MEQELQNNREWHDKTILIAEDIDINYKFIEVVVIKTKAKIIRAHNGQEAIDICKINNDINLILMDIMMPEVDGFEATTQIKKFKKELPIIAQTAFGNDIDQDKLNKAGFDGFLSKPIKLDELIGVLNKFFK